MFPANPDAINDDNDDPAAFWFARMNGGSTPSLADETGFRGWIEADPGNIETYRRCQAAWRALGVDAGAPEILALRAKALRSDTRMTRRRALFGMGGGAIAASAAGVWVLTASSPARARIVTKAGQRLTAPLPDGSEVTLAPLTRLRLDYSGDRRGAILETGQAYFNILPDRQKPFTVVAGDRAMEAVGSRFQVTLLEGEPDVVVEDGAVTVARKRDRSTTLARLVAGQGIQGAGGELKVGSADVEGATAWRLGRLVVRDRPLSEVVADFNRYSSDRLVLQDEKAGAVRVSGSFRYDGGREFVLALASGFDLVVKHEADGAWRIGTPEGSATLR